MPGRRGCGDVDRARDRCRHEVGDRSHLVLEADPAPVLPAGAQVSAESEPQQREQSPERTTLLAEHQSRADVRDPDLRLSRFAGRRLPLRYDVGEESLAPGRGLGEDLVAAIAVVACLLYTSDAADDLLCVDLG